MRACNSRKDIEKTRFIVLAYCLLLRSDRFVVVGTSAELFVAQTSCRQSIPHLNDEQEKTMKTTFAALISIIINLLVYSAFSTEPPGAEIESVAERPNMLIAELHIRKIQQAFTGTVMKTETGLTLDTVNGIYLLKGLSLEEDIGKEVNVKGVVKIDTDAERNSIYVVKFTK